jgi:hypothetical protein
MSGSGAEPPPAARLKTLLERPVFAVERPLSNARGIRGSRGGDVTQGAQRFSPSRCLVRVQTARPCIEAAKAMLANPDIAVTQIAQRLGVSPATLYRFPRPTRNDCEGVRGISVFRRHLSQSQGFSNNLGGGPYSEDLLQVIKLIQRLVINVKPERWHVISPTFA